MPRRSLAVALFSLHAFVVRFSSSNLILRISSIWPLAGNPTLPSGDFRRIDNSSPRGWCVFQQKTQRHKGYALAEGLPKKTVKEIKTGYALDLGVNRQDIKFTRS